MRAVLLAVVSVVALTGLPAARQPDSDLDALMARVLARRDDNWQKLQQYVLDERETFDLRGPGGAPLYGFARDYTWFPRDGVFVRSPLRVNGVTLSEAERLQAEASWIRRERRREQRRRDRDPATTATPPASPPPAAAVSAASAPSAPSAAAVSAPSAPSAPSAAVSAPSEASAAPPPSALSVEPGFVSSAYFLRFRFEPGRYALVGREPVDGQAALRIEYYPSALFREGRTRPNRRVRDRDAEVEDRMNKVSLVTLWVDPVHDQILQYTFDDIDMSFLPGRSVARVDDVKATMRMSQPFPGVWLPRDIVMRFRMLLASGPIEATYRVDYRDYRQASVAIKVR